MSTTNDWLDELFPNLRAWHDKNEDLHTVEEVKVKISTKITQLVNEAYRRGYSAGHMKGTHGKSKKELRFSYRNYYVCEGCRLVREEAELQSKKGQNDD